MIGRRNFLTLLGAGVGSGGLAFSHNNRQPASDSGSNYPRDATPDPCKDTFADPPWKRLSSANGDLPVPETSDQQTGCIVGDIDKDGRLDFVITNRKHGNAAIWMQNTAHGVEAACHRSGSAQHRGRRSSLRC